MEVHSNLYSIKADLLRHTEGAVLKPLVLANITGLELTHEDPTASYNVSEDFMCVKGKKYNRVKQNKF